MSRANLIAKNTIFLYIRMMIVMVINLFAVRIVLKALGTVDYGIYNVVAGVITMLSCVTSVLMTATQRFYSYYIGESNYGSLNKIFSISLEICVLGSIIIIFIGETLGLWFVNNYLTIPIERLNAANWLYQMTIVSFVLSFLQIPFGAAIIAHEKMGYFAAISTIETFLKFGAALLLLIITKDKLITYGVFLAITSLVTLIIYISIALRKFNECHYKRIRDYKLFRELLSFSGWNFVGSLAGVGMHYVNTILVNIFFGPVVNAAQAISFQISSALNTFSGSFIMALRPPMIKLYAEKDFTRLDKLFSISNKVVFYCILMLCVPIFLELDTIILLWLDVSDSQTVLFGRLIIIYTIILVMNNPISIIMQATGYVKQYFLSVELVTLLCPIITYILFKVGFPAYSVFLSMIVCVSVAHIVRLSNLKKYYPLPVIRSYIFFCLKALLISILVIIISLIIKNIISSDIIRLLVILLSSLISTILLSYLFALSNSERKFIILSVKSFLEKK